MYTNSTAINLIRRMLYRIYMNCFGWRLGHTRIANSHLATTSPVKSGTWAMITSDINKKWINNDKEYLFHNPHQVAYSLTQHILFVIFWIEYHTQMRS